MVRLEAANSELFLRAPDERYETFGLLKEACRRRREASLEHWSGEVGFRFDAKLGITLSDMPFQLNDWSFGQLCRLSRVSKDTVNKLSPKTASQVLLETLPRLRKPLQVYSAAGCARSIHGTTYTRLYDEEVLSVVSEFETEFTPPPKGVNGGTGLYSGEQDMFCFLIDEGSRIEIRGESFAPGLFVWNSEVGKRSVGISTFWYQHVCQNHIVWDAVDVVEIARKHTANVHRSLNEIRKAIEQLIAVRDQRIDAFSRTVDQAMDASLGASSDEVAAVLRREGIPGDVTKRVVASTTDLSLFGVVDSITRIAGEVANAGDRLALDSKAASLLSLAS